jgi:ABC-type transport system involved in multi-copper enzyme maturation permease subunit
MFTTLYFRELQNYLYSLRFFVSFVIVVLVFTIGSISFVSSFTETQSNYSQYRQNEQAELAEQAGISISAVATTRRNFVMTPMSNGVLADCKESILPNDIEYSAYNVFGFSVRHNTLNPLLSRAESLSWSFIVSMFLSFITLLFAFDAISGEKEECTLALVFSNNIPRRTFLGSKLAGILTVVGCMELVGIILSLFILTISGKVLVDGAFLLETAGFFCISLLLITVFAVFGLFSSVVTRHSNISLLVSLCFWLVVAVVIPNTSVFWAKKLFPIPSTTQVEAAIREERNDLEANGAEGRWSSNGGDPFYPRNELRANHQTDIMNSEKRHRDAYYRQMFRQFENTRSLTVISPIAQFDYINEAFLGGGYLRFRKNWDDLQLFQPQFLQWFKDIDAKDSDSPHWYNPNESYSTSHKPVEVDQIPRYREQIAPFARRLQFIAPYLITMLLTGALLFGGCFYYFTRYDVR